MKKINNYHIIITNILFLLFPLSIILGNFAININLILISLIGSWYFFIKKIKIKFNFYDKLIFLFFFYSILSLLINFLESYLANSIFEKFIFYKTFFFLRYLIFYISIRVLIEEKILNINYFIISCSFFVFVVCLDIYIQYFFGKNIIGISPSSDRHFSGFFGKELIAGGYIQRFAILTFFLPFLQNKLFLTNFLKLFFLFFFLYGIILTGNKMPFVLFLLIIFIYFFLKTSIKKYLLKISILIFLTLIITFNNNHVFKINITNLYNHSINLTKTLFVDDLKKLPENVWQKPYVNEFNCAKRTIKENPIFGGGIKSFRTVFELCNSHPHNYYLEIFSDLGFIGLFIFLTLVIYLFKNFIFNNDRKIINFPFFLIIFAELFPIRSSGSFFSTNNASIIFLFLAIFISLKYHFAKKDKEFKEII